MPKKVDVRYLFSLDNYTYLGEERLGKIIKYKYKCDKGHQGSIKISHWNDGHRCSVCSGNKRLTIAHVKESFYKENYKLITTKYKNSGQLLKYKCNNGHIHLMSWNNWSTGCRCPSCVGKIKKTLTAINNKVVLEGYSLHSENLYKNNKTPIHLICPNKHDYFVSWDNWNSKNSRCPKCGLLWQSKAELELFNFIKNICYDAIHNDREIIKPYELDIVIPSKKIAIEYCGLYWHSELMGKDKNYHLNKLSSSSIEDYRLITIFEDEFISNKEIVLSTLIDILNSDSKKRIHAYRCTIHEISLEEARNFCIENHLQGYYGSDIKLGAFYHDELVSVMTFSEKALFKVFKGNKNIIELSRFCNKICYKVTGTASKLFNYFINNYSSNYDSVVSHVDRRWSDGSLYKTLGFTFDKYTPPNYWYFKSNKKRFHGFQLKKPHGVDKNITEWEFRKAEGWNRIWDCGNLKFVKELS